MTWPQIAFGIGSWLTLNAFVIAYLLDDYRREQKRGVR